MARRFNVINILQKNFCFRARLARVTVVRIGVIVGVARAAVQSRLQNCLHCNNKPTSNSVG